MLPLNDMILFVDVVKYKSFTIAAKKNNITPAGISKRISSLEDVLCVKLLKRTTRSLALTEAGKILYQHCHTIPIEFQNIIEIVRESHYHPRGKIKIAALQNVTNLIIAPLVDTFFKLYSDIEIVITFDEASSPLPPVNEYDVAFKSGKLIDSSAIARLLFAHDYTVCATPVYFEKYGIPNNLEDLKNHNCVDCGHELKIEKNTWIFYDEKQRHSVPIKGNIRTDNALLAKSIALNNAALIYSPTFIVADEINAGKLISVLTQYRTIENSIYIIHPYTNRSIPVRVKTFIDFVFNNIKIPSIVL